MAPAIHVLYEDDDRSAVLFDALAARDLPVVRWHMAEGMLDPEATPPEGVFYNRMSASSHRRGHRFAPELTEQTLAWLGRHGRRVINDVRAVRLEIDKLAQLRALAAAGIRVPRTVAGTGRAATLAAARRLDRWPAMLKPNRGGSGAGVVAVESPEHLAAVLDDPATEAPLDGLWLVQDYVQSADRTITRCEFVGGAFLYALRVDTSEGFELCPADACEIETGRPRFEIVEGFGDPLVARCERFLAENGIEVAGIEFVRDADGLAHVYDVNTNTNYNSAAEAKAGLSGMDRLAEFLGRELDRAAGRAAA